MYFINLKSFISIILLYLYQKIKTRTCIGLNFEKARTFKAM